MSDLVQKLGDDGHCKKQEGIIRLQLLGGGIHAGVAWLEVALSSLLEKVFPNCISKLLLLGK